MDTTFYTKMYREKGIEALAEHCWLNITDRGMTREVFVEIMQDVVDCAYDKGMDAEAKFIHDNFLGE